MSHWERFEAEMDRLWVTFAAEVGADDPDLALDAAAELASAARDRRAQVEAGAA